MLSIFTLVGSYFAVSSADLGAALYLQAPQQLQTGRETAARGIVMDAPTGRLFSGARSRFSIQGKPVAEAKTQGHGYMHVALAPPEGLSGKQPMDVLVEHASSAPLQEQAVVEITDAKPAFAWPVASSRRSSDPTSKGGTGKWEGDLVVQAIPQDGEVPRGLPADAFLILADAQTGAPVQGEITVTKTEGMLRAGPQTKLVTDELGMVAIPLEVTTAVRFTLEATAGERRGSGTVRFESVASQFSLRMRQLYATPGQALRADVATLHRSGGILVDLYDGDRWVAADAYAIGPQGAGVRAILPEVVDNPVVRLQVYNDFFDAAGAWDARWVAVSPSAAPDACPDVLARVLSLHAAQGGPIADWADYAQRLDTIRNAPKCAKRLEAALLAIPHAFVPAPLLVNTQDTGREELEEWKAEVQTHLMAATVAVLLGGFAIVLGFVVQGLRRREEQALAFQAVDAELDVDDDAEPAAPSFDYDRALLYAHTFVIIATLFTFGACIVMLLRWM